MRYERRHKKRFYLLLVSISFVLWFLINIPIKIAIARYQQPFPQAILSLGGGTEREECAAQLARSHPTLPIWVSSGTPPSDDA